MDSKQSEMHDTLFKLLLPFSILLLFLFLLLFPTFSDTSVRCTCVQCTVGSLNSFSVFLLFLLLFTSGFSSSSSSAFLFNVTSAAALYSSTSLLDSYLSNLALCVAVVEILVTSPPSSCRMRDSTLAR